MRKPCLTVRTARALDELAGRIRSLGEQDKSLVQCDNRKALEFIEKLVAWKLSVKEVSG